MELMQLFENIDVRRAAHGSCDVARLCITRVITAPEENCEDALYVACRTPLENGRYGMQLAYARGCRAFLCTHNAFPDEEAAVFVADEPEALLGILAARVYGHPARSMSVIGITGSAGKTSVAAQSVQILRAAGRRVGALTSDGLDILGECAPHTPIVPNAAQIQHALLKMAQNGCEIAIVELSSYQLAHHAAVGIDFTAVLLTNLLPRHIGHGEHQSFAEYRAVKLSLLRAQSAFCVLPVGEAHACGGRALFVGDGGDFWAEDLRTQYIPPHIPRTRFVLCDKEEKAEVELHLVGDFAVQNALCAAALCRILGLRTGEIARGLCVPFDNGRIRCVSAYAGRLIYLDAAFLPEDLETVLCTLRPLARGRVCVLLGSVGGRARARRKALARAAQAQADFVYLSADDPDFEDPEEICTLMLDAMPEPARACVIPDRRAAILRAVREMRAGDLLLILAKPTPRAQLIGGRYLPFDERAVVREALAEL